MQLISLAPVDYLVIGHITIDLVPGGSHLGGTVLYSALTARALGMRVGIVTSWGEELTSTALMDIPIYNVLSERSTTFENVYTEHGRVQNVHSLAGTLDYHVIPDPWRKANIIHLGPVAQEIAPAMIRNLQYGLIGVTPQGWMRSWDSSGRVIVSEWPEAAFVLERCGAAIISVDDVGGDENRIEEMALHSRVFVVTEGSNGARVYWNGDVRRFRAPLIEPIDPTGAGDIFAATFFTRLYMTRDPWEAGRYATQLASLSVSRKGLDGIPTPKEIQENLVEVY